MNKCPKCQRNYDDKTLFFCLEDGEKLIPDQSSSYSIPTVVVTKKTPVPPTAPVYQPEPVKSKTPFYIALAVAVVLFFSLATGVFAFWILRGKSSAVKNPPDKVVKNNETEKNLSNNEDAKTSNKSDILDFSSPETLSYLEKEGLLIALKSQSNNPNPLALNLHVSENGDLTLNTFKLGNVSGENTLAAKLTEIFQEREKNKITSEGANTIEKTVTIIPPKTIGREIFEKTYRIVKDTNPSSIKVVKP